jgi:hypothetical protein
VRGALPEEKQSDMKNNFNDEKKRKVKAITEVDNKCEHANLSNRPRRS